MRSGAESIYSSSSSSFEVIDISHSFPPNISGLKTFFTAPSERRLRRRRSSRLLRHSNSSSESVGDLAYGHGYLRRPKRKVRSRKGKEIDRERHSERERERNTERYSDREREKSGIGRATTDAEILAVGAGLAKLAREQNKLDLKAAARGGKQVFATKEFGRRDEGPSRGLAPSKISHESDTVDEEGWESASDAGSESSVDSKLAFGAESQGGWGFFGRKQHHPQSRKSSVVDPRMFGPANSLHGVVTEPVGFGEVAWTSSSDFGQHPFTVPPAESVASGSQPSMQHVYPIATDDSTRFEAGRSSVISGPEPYVSSRPGPIPIQQPQPITPVSQSVYEPIYATRSESGSGILKKTPTPSGRSKSLAEAALFGVAGAAVGAAIASDRKDDRKERHRNDDRDTREEDRTSKRRDSERKDTKDARRRDKHDSPDRDDRKEKRREKERTKDSSDDRKDKKREKRRDDAREETRDERRERRREERRSERGDDGYDDRRSERVSVDPFQYQVDDDAFATPNNEPATRHGRVQSVPTVVTVEREPDFARKRGSSIKDQPVSSRSESTRKDYADWDDKEQRRDRDSRDRPLREAESIYQEAEHFTAPIDAAAISAAIAAEGYRESRSERRRDERRGERRSDYDDYDYKPREKESKRDSKDYDDYDRKSRDKESAPESKRERERDPVQEDADRAYREIVMARKIASQVIRSRSPSPNRSVIDKYEDKEEEEVVRIVTPPGMDDHKKKGLYDAPNADFQLDYVLKDPQEIRRFGLPSYSFDLSNAEGPYLKKDPDASQPRPLLNLVLPTPSPSPMPEKQVARSEPARPSKPKEETTTTTASDVIIGPKGSVVASPSASTVSKGVTWGENETKHFEVESPPEHRDEFVSSPEMRAHDDPVEQAKTRARDSPIEQPKSPNGSKRGGWGAIAAGIIGAGAGVAVASSSSTSQTSKSSKTKEDDKKQEAPYEYRGVVVEPESPPRSQRPESPPSTGPKPASSQTSQPSHIPGAFDDDLDFTATVAAGLQDTGFDPNIVINDSKFRRRDSPPGSNEPSFYRAPYAETVSDLGSILRDSPSMKDSQGFVVGEVAVTPKDWPTISPDEDTLSKLSKKEQKKREKAAKRQSGDFTPVDEGPKSKQILEEPDYFETKLSKKEQKKRDKEARRQGSQAEDMTPFDEPSIASEIVEEPGSYFDEPKKKKKSKKGSSSYDDDAEDVSRDTRKVSVPVDAFDDLRNGEDEWSETKNSKRKSKRDSERYDSPSRSVPSDIASPLERASSLSKKSRDKSKRKSDSFEPDPTEVSLPPSTPSENSRDGDFDDLRGTRKSSNKDSADRSESHSVVSADASRYDEDEPRKSKRKSKSRDDFDDTRSVASAPAGDDYDSKKSKKRDKDKKNSGGFFGLFGSKSEVGAGDDSPKRAKDDFEDIKKKSKKSKRNSMPDASSLYGDIGSESMGDLSRITSNGNGNGNGTYHFDDDRGRDSRDETKKKSRKRDDSETSKKDSFLAKAGTLGAGVGFAGAAVAIAAQRHQQSNADNAYKSNETAGQIRSRGSSQFRQLEEILDPEITQRQFRPSIDPQYGDLLPLPPSDPVSPNVEPIDDLPDLPDSRPNTPEAERLLREMAIASVRKSIQDTPVKSPSHSAVPLKFLMGNRSNPSSPGAIRASPMQSPAMPSQDSLQFPRTRTRPTSWDSTKEYKPLYLVESNRRGSNVQQQEIEEPLPALPPSHSTSRSSSQMDSSDEATFEDAEQYPSDMQVRFVEPLSVDTALASTKPSTELLDSQQSTPKAAVFQYLDADQGDEPLPEHKTVDVSDSPSLPTHRSVSPQTEEYHDSHTKTAAEVIAGAALVSSIGYFASSPVHRPTDKSFLDELLSHSEVQRQPSPVDTMTKDRSSYLLQSSPMSRKTEDDDFIGRVEDSPTSRQGPLQSDKDVLHSIQERERGHFFEQSREFQPLIEQERERTLDALSGSSYDQPAVQEETRDLGDRAGVGEALPELERESATDAPEEVQPSDEFGFTKPKKDRKKDKKGKGLSRSSTQDDIILAETSQEPYEALPALVDVEPAEELSLPESKDKKKGKRPSRPSTQDDFSFEEPSREIADEPSTTADAEPTEEFSMSKSKKDKKKGKGLSRSSTQDDFALGNTNREITEEPATHADVEPSEEFSMPKSKKDKKKGKKGKSVPAWEAEEDSVAQTPEESFDTAEAVPEEMPDQDDFIAATRKSKKKDKKNRKSTITWEPEEEAATSAPIDNSPTETSRHLLEETAVPVGLGIATYEALKQSQEPTSSIQHEEEEAPEPVKLKEVNVFDMQDEGKPSESTQDQPTFPMEAQEAEQPSQITRDLLPETGRDMPQHTSVPDDFTTSTSKKSKKTMGKLVSPREPEEEQGVPPPAVDEPKVVDEFIVSGSKKSKKKGKKSQSWTPEESFPSETVLEQTDLPTSQTEVLKVEGKPAENDFDSFVPGSKKGKKKGKKSQSWTPEEIFPAESVQESTESLTNPTDDRELVANVKPNEQPADDFDQFVTPGSKKSKKKSRKSQVWEEEPLSELKPEVSEDKPIEPKVLTPALETFSTLMGEPEAWPVTPATPWATANEEPPESLSTEYFPSTATLHSPVKQQSSNDAASSGYFPSAAAILQVTAAGTAVLATDHLDKKSDDNILPVTPASRDLETDQPDAQSTQPVPDGLKAGYDNDQLSLARQLQEEFGSGSKRSKKDKKKRQSLPVTPNRDFSRSRDPNEALEDHHRARSLSIGPSPSTERVANRPTSEDRKNVYSEDQLELARQLKAEFEGGNKKSRKDKKKRQSLSRTLTQDDATFDQPAEEPQSMEPETVEDLTLRQPAESTRDGFEAGYQEDQLSLARQLQTEFGSGSKKSKKDKKRRSTSQTPTQEPEPQTDYFGDTSQPQVTETWRDLERADAPESSVTDKEAIRDGLAVGYDEEQLELARQLKEEFGSGSRRSKKDKKDKKRQSLLRNTTVDDFSSDYVPKDGNEPRDIDVQNIDTAAVQLSEPTPVEPEDEFVSTSKKSKRDKKGKKGESLVSFTNDDTPPENITKELDKPHDADLREVIETGPSEPPPDEPEDEFLFTTKKSKKDRKGKKRESLILATNEDEVISETTTKDIDGSANIEDFQPATTEAEPSEPPAENPEDGFGLIRKKSKKDKKSKRLESLIPAAKEDEVLSETATKYIDESANIEDLQPAVIETETNEPAAAEPDDEFSLSRKKSKKDKKGKKRDSPLRSTTDDALASDNFGRAVEALHNTREIPSEEVGPSEEPASAPFEDDWASTTKKSKKDKKKRQSLATQQDAWDQPAAEMEPAQLQPEEESSTVDATAVSAATEVIDEPADESGFSTKKSKKDKKKRQSLLRSSTFDDTPERQHGQIARPEESVSRDLGGDTVTPLPSLADKQDDGFEFTPEKSKEDMEKRQSTQHSSFADETPRDSEEPSSAQQDLPITEYLGKETPEPIVEAEVHNHEMTGHQTILEDNIFEQPAQTVEEDSQAQFEDFAFTMKKSKKDKKRTGLSVPDPDESSGVSTPLDPVQEAPSRHLFEETAVPVALDIAVTEAFKQPEEPTAIVPETSITTEHTLGQTEEPLSRDMEDSVSAEAAETDVVEDRADELGSFSTRKSRKDKKKRKSGLTTLIEEISQESDATTPKDPVDMDEPKEIPEQVADPVYDEWGSFTTKESKKDKKNRKSSLSTPVEDAPVEPEAVSQQAPTEVEESKQIVPEQVQDPVDDEWGSFTTKKSKKDKKNRKSSLSMPAEDAPVELEAVSQQAPTEVEEAKEAMLEQVQDPVDDEWASLTTKRSKKDKRKSKSGLLTPLESLPEPESTTQRELPEVEEAKPPQLEEFAEPISTKLEGTEELQPQAEEPVDEEWGSFTTKKSKRDRKENRSDLSTPPETLAESENSTTQCDIPKVEDTKSQLEELMEGSTWAPKKPKKGKKNKSGFSTPLEDTQPEPASQETQRSIDDPDPQFQETSVEPAPTSQEEYQEAEEHQPQELVDDEWDSFTTKQSKKGKKSKSGLSTPLEETAQPELTTQDDEIKEDPAPQQVEDAGKEEWGSLTTKKSKKDKKRKSGLSTSIEEPQSQVTSREEQVSLEKAEAQQLGDAGEEWSSFTMKPSKKDKKKRKSGLSTPLEETLQPKASTQMDLADSEEPQPQLPYTEQDLPTAQIDQAPQETDDVFGFTSKKSKMDKKKRKSGVSTTIEEALLSVEPEEPSQTQPTEFDEPKSQSLPIEPEMETSKDLSQSTGNDQEDTNDAFAFVTKKSKKDKMKRKSGLSTPTKDTLPPVEPEQPSRELAFNEPTTHPRPIEHDKLELQTGQDDLQVPPPETADDGLWVTTKKSKKDKKGKRASRVNSESSPSSSATPSASVPATDIGTEDPAHLVSERLTQSPVPFEKDISTAQTITESDPNSTIQREALVESQVDEHGEFQLDLGRKPSKKDKRKRQATVDASIYGGPGASKAPLTSWADEVEEAEVEREVPVIQDIAKDESLSHIASTTDTAPVDDFSRPTKKGKKGKKRNSGLVQESSMDDSVRPPIGEDLPEKKSDEHSDIPILTSAGVALAGAALLSSKYGEGHPEPLTSFAAPTVKEVDIAPPTRKLSKKEKRKQSIDRRTPKDDPFDDPALWESAEPRAFEESGERNDDAGNDGFWSASTRDENISTKEPVHPREFPHEGPVDLFAPAPAERTQESAHVRVPESDNIQSDLPRDLPRSEQQWNDLPVEDVTTSSKKDRKKRKQSRLAAWDIPQEQEESREIEQPISHPLAEPRTVVEEPHVEKRTSFEQRPATPPNDFVEESPVDRHLSFQDDQFQPRSSLRYSHQDSSGLPVVQEESPVQLESEHFERPSYPQGTDDINRDSAFVTDSPIPGQRPFADEHIRDSGVHLRESSPLERAVAPVSNSDDAIARLSWPAVDEASETVDLHRSQRPKIETTTRHHGEKEGAADTYRSHQPEERQERDFHQSYTLEAERPHRHHEDRDLLPSQRHHDESHTDLHRTKTIHRHGSEGERQRHHEEDRDLLQSQVHKEESYTDLHRTKTMHRSQKPESIVKQRVQRIESPDLERSQTSQQDKYGDLNTSQRPKAEKPKTASDNSMGTAAAIAGATVGFAAARQASREKRPDSAQSQRSSSNINRLRTPIQRPESVGSNRSSGTPPLRRSDRKSGDLRSLSQRSNLDLAKEAELAAITAAAVEASTTASANPQANEGRVRAKEMADVYVR